MREVQEAVDERGLAAVVGMGGSGAVMLKIFECSTIQHIQISVLSSENTGFFHYKKQ